MMTHEQVDEIENKLRQAQNLVEECGSAICDERENGAPDTWNRLTSTANDIGDIICGLWMLRPEA
jgi:hypothetical protein